MATAFSLALGLATFRETSPNLNKDARITKLGDKAEDGNSVKVEKSPNQPSPRRNTGLLAFYGDCVLLLIPFVDRLLPQRR
ncbi:hypothetical protein KIL84_009270 [Mauremys mutica]|uniref:Uncharacterized protein n=1 Tax=Mauremys mutica TaxID=74926 RepID=A0A9D4B4S8_9SAUR|nr:hypothetical protein KIL84_009270 [Mauremys mutica]